LKDKTSPRRVRKIYNLKSRKIELAISGDIYSKILEGIIWTSYLKDFMVEFFKNIYIDEDFSLAIETRILKQL